MLTVMMRQAIRKKFSQKTNDYKIKSLIDYMTSTSGSENSELILFCHLIGLQPKPTIKLSAGMFLTVICCKYGIDGVLFSAQDGHILPQQYSLVPYAINLPGETEPRKLQYQHHRFQQPLNSVRK